VVAAIAFLFAPYVLRNMFERGTPEAFSMVLYPWVIWSLVWLAQRPSSWRLLLASLIWAACIASHVLAPLILAPFALVVALLLVWHYRSAAPLIALVAGGLLTAFIWAPMVFEQANVHVERDFSESYANPVENPIPMDRLLAAPVVYDTQRDNNQMGDRLGWPNALMLVLAMPVAVVAWRKGHRNLAIILGFSALAAVLLFWMLTSGSDPFWRLMEGALRRLQYRSRLMGVLALAIAVASGTLVALLPRRWQTPGALLLGALFILAVLPSLYVDLLHVHGIFGNRVTLADVREAEIRTQGTAFTQFGEFTPRWRTAPFGDALLAEIGTHFEPQDMPLVQPSPQLTVLSSQVRSHRWDLQLAATEPTTATLHLLYYPHWRALVDGDPQEIHPQTETGYSQIAVPAGQHTIALQFARLPGEALGIGISLLTLFVLIGLGLRDLLQRRSRAVSLPLATPIVESGIPWWLLVALTVFLAFKWFYVDPATSWLRCVSTLEQVCGATDTVNVEFSGGPAMRGYALPSRTVTAGQDLRLTLYWQAGQRPVTNLNGFVHVRNSQKDWPLNPQTGSELWGQQDNFTPGNLSTTDFIPGKLYQDEYRVPIPENTPPGEYYLEVGWFDPASGEQLAPIPESVEPPLDILWRSILLPSIRVQ
jgi:hypothetical protein